MRIDTHGLGLVANVRAGLMLIVHAGTSRPQARLSLAGDWYARTLVTQDLATQRADKAR